MPTDLQCHSSLEEQQFNREFAAALSQRRFLEGFYVAVASDLYPEGGAPPVAEDLVSRAAEWLSATLSSLPAKGWSSQPFPVIVDGAEVGHLQLMVRRRRDPRSAAVVKPASLTFSYWD